MLDEPLLEGDFLARDLLLVAFALELFGLELFDLADLGFDDFDLVDDFAPLDADRFFWDWVLV
ncbi:MAG TPA: hypothetical protein VGV69_05310 [Solirubrobacterales bacterium]|nr:hypothetical protein [Solirubrobacterales bacterium]